MPSQSSRTLQTPEERAELEGAYECILCGACTSSCPSFWWHPDKFVGPSALLQAWRFIADSRDQATEERLDNLEDAYRLYRCRGHHELRGSLPQGPQPDRGHRQDPLPAGQE